MGKSLSLSRWSAQLLICVEESMKKRPGGRLNVKMSSYQYRDPHVKDKTVSRPSYLQLTWESPFKSLILSLQFLYWGDSSFILRRPLATSYALAIDLSLSRKSGFYLFNLKQLSKLQFDGSMSDCCIFIAWAVEIPQFHIMCKTEIMWTRKTG